VKKVTITALVSDDVVQNELKNWVKTCPYSLEGGQTVTWENIPDPEPTPVSETDAPAEA
jgi:hypothetical protein